MIDTPIHLTDIHDNRLDPYRDLRNQKPERLESTVPHRLFVVEGRLNVCRLLESDLHVDSVLIQQGKSLDSITQLLASKRNSPQVLTLGGTAIRSLVGFDFHRGFLACAHRPVSRAALGLMTSVSQLETVLGVIGVSEAENLGSLFRSAAAFGIRNVLIGPGTIDTHSRRVVRVSMGTIFKLNLYHSQDVVADLHQLHELGWESIATTLDSNATEIKSWHPTSPHRIVLMGNEAKGLSAAIQQAASSQVRIAMAGGVDSLNVAVAGAVFMHHATGLPRFDVSDPR